MAAFKIYIDDSGDEPNPQHSVISMADYVSDKDHWARFEAWWADILEGYEVPYLHMREWWNNDGIYKELKKDKEHEAEFFSDLVYVIEQNTTYCANAIIKLADLRAFNAEYGLHLDAYAFALYACLIELRKGYPDQDIEIVIDKVSKANKRIELARQYAEMDTYADLKSDGILILPLQKDESFKTVLPIQAADFMAWELRKLAEERKEFDPEDNTRISREAVNESYRKWALDFERIKNRKPRRRRSALGLEYATPQSGYLWDLYNIRAAHLIRHKNGWG